MQANNYRQGRAASRISTTLCLLLPLTASAGKNFGPGPDDHSLEYALLFLLFLLACSVTCAILAAHNIARGNRNITIIGILLTLPLLATAAYLATFWTAGGFAGFAIVLLHWLHIYAGIPRKKIS